MTAEDATAARRVPVLLPLPLEGAYDYRVPEALEPSVGSFVSVPLGPRLVPGVVWDGAVGEIAEAKLRDVEEVLDAPPLNEELRRFVDWVAAYTLAPPGAVLRMTMSVADALVPPRPGRAVAITEKGRALLDRFLSPQAGEGARLSPQRRRCLVELAGGPPRGMVDLARAAGCGSGVVKGLVEAGLAAWIEVGPARRPSPDWRRPGPAFSPEQRRVADALAATARGGFSVTLLEGVTGSGKTEVYFEAIAAALEADRQALVLLPEIALGAQFLKRFERRFGVEPAVWHSDVPHAERRLAWRQVAEGSARVVVGARSALFLPFPRLGLVVVDEEHDSSFKQEDGVVYHARDMAVVRARLAGAAAILASATPSLETLDNVARGRYAHLELPDRHGGARLPEIRIIDMRREKLEPRRFLAPKLVAALGDALAGGEQAMLFLNRRGYAPLTLCRSCGHRLHCPNCTAWLVEHRFRGRLQCHHCGYTESPPSFCVECGARESFAACGPGIERIAEEVSTLFPTARARVMASDTLPGPRAIAEMIEAVEAHAVDILIGTQVMAKGHHFPLLTLVGVVDADLGLSGGDLRAAERTWQLLSQVAGRAGRADRPGTVLVQTYLPENPVIAALAAQDRERFLAVEAEARRRHGMPPYGRLAALVISSPDADEADFIAAAFARAAPQMPGISVLGPAPAPLALLRGRHRRRLLLKARRDIHVQPALRDWLGRVKVPGTARVQVDVDPYSFL
jgi:primosomal protein N' (replication factor Y)